MAKFITEEKFYEIPGELAVLICNLAEEAENNKILEIYVTSGKISNYIYKNENALQEIG